MTFPRSALVAMLAALVVVTPALADSGSGEHGDGAATATGRCSKGTSSELRLQSRDGSIRVDFTVKRRRAHESWRVVFVHERRVAWRGTVRTTGSGAFRVRRSYDDYEGADSITARASGPGGLTCTASATLEG